MSKEKGRDHSYRSLTRAMAAMTAFSVLAGLAVAGRAAAQAPGVDQATAATVAQPADAAAESLTEQIKQAEGAARVEKARALLAFLAANHDAIGRDTFARAMWRIFIALRAQPADAAAFTILREDLEAIIARLRATGNGEAELRFAVWLEYLVPEDARLGIARMVHRRAAALGMLTGDIARKARGSIADHARRLRKEGRIEEALRALEDTFAELAAAGLERSAASRSELRLYAEVLTQMRRDAEADSLFAHLIETAPEGSAEQCLAINQAAYYRNLVGRFAAAETPGLQAAECAERLYGRKAISTQKARFNYAMALLGQGQAAKALPFLEEALPLQLAREADPFDFSDAEADTIILLTALARARAQLPGHERAALESAHQASTRLRKRQQQRLDLELDSAAPAAAMIRAMARSDRRDPLASAYDMALLAGWVARDLGGEPFDIAFRAAQDLTFDEAGNALSDAAARDIAGAGPLGDLVRERQDLAATLVSSIRKLRELSLGADQAESAELAAQVDDLARRLAVLDQRLEREFPDYQELVAPRSVGLAELKQWLGPDEALLMTLPSEGAQYVFAVSAADIAWHRIDNGAMLIGQAVERLRCRLDETTCSEAEIDAMLAAEERSAASAIDRFYPRYDRATAHSLYQQLIAPVARVLPRGGKVYVVARGAMAGLPLALLVASPPAGDPESGDAADLQATDWLGEHHAFITLPAVSALRLAQIRGHDEKRGEARLPLIGYGAPVLIGSGNGGDRGAGDERRRRGGLGVRAVGSDDLFDETALASVERLRRLDPLPGTLVELSRLAERIGNGRGVRIGKAATEAAIKADRDLARADTVVFATHGVLPDALRTGSQPGLVFTPPRVASLRDDGLLTAAEAAALSLSARWVVLSACNTATPGLRERGGEALSSLARSFLYAGARNLLASHWRVADDATAALTAEVLTSAEESPARALAAAMAAIRNGRRADGSPVEGWQAHWAHPASWAPFILITDADRSPRNP